MVQAGTACLLGLYITCSLLLASPLAAGQAKLAQPDYNIYLKKNDLLKKVEELVEAHQDIMKIELRHAADGDYKADLQVVTVEPEGISPTHRTKARLLIDFGEHGREFISSEVGLKFLQVLADPAQMEAMVSSSRRLARIKAILQHTVFKILPMENVNGRTLVESGQLCERKNGRGVDTNRNWDIDWGRKEKDYDPREEFPGRAPHSEPEVQILLALAKELQPHTWLNVHSGMYALFTPYDHKAAVPNTTDARAALRMLQRIKELSCPECVVGSGGHSVGYLAHGTGTDYMYEVLGVPMSFTWEIYGDEKASFEDCFKMFNPLSKEQFDRVVTLWVKAMLQLIELLPTHPATWPIFKAAGLTADGDAAAAGSTSAPAAAEQQQQQQKQQQQQQQQPTDGGSKPTASPGQASPEAAEDTDDTYVETPDSSSSSSSSSDDVQQAGQEAAAPSIANTRDSESSDSTSQEISIHRDHLVSDQQDLADAEPSAGWVLLHSNRLLPLLLALAGMGVLLYFVSRPPGVPYTKLAGRSRTL